MKILAAEDNPVFQAMLRSLLRKWDYDVVVARDGEEAWSILNGDDAPRLAILDWMMPGVDGVEVCRRVRLAAREPYIYLILLTARSHSEDLVEGMEAGADDYLTKPFNAHELRVRLRAGRRILDLQEELVVAREALRSQATYDALTGLYNRANILDALQRELARADRTRSPLAVLMMDLDFFKNVNDTYGHLTGDVVLRESAQRLTATVREYDAAGRYGGEEFLVVVSGSDYADSVAQAERIRMAIGGAPFEAPGRSIPVTCSIGVCWSSDPSPDQAHALMKRADDALYAAKKAGRNCVQATELSCLKIAV